MAFILCLDMERELHRSIWGILPLAKRGVYPSIMYFYLISFFKSPLVIMAMEDMEASEVMGVHAVLIHL